MTLKEYKEKYKLTAVKMAKMFQTSPSCIHHWVKGVCKPMIKSAIIIRRVTKGEVSFKDLGIE